MAILVVANVVGSDREDFSPALHTDIRTYMSPKDRHLVNKTVSLSLEDP